MREARNMSEVETLEYLQGSVGAALSDAYAALVTSQPADGAEFLGKFLKQYAAAEEFRLRREEEEKSRDEYMFSFMGRIVAASTCLKSCTYRENLSFL